MTPSTPSVRAVVARHAEATADNRVFFHPDIPEHRLVEALNGYPGVKPEDVLVLLDNTDSGSADEGALLTADTLHVHDHGQPPRRFTLDGLGVVCLEPGPPRVLEIGGGAVLMHLRVRPETMERFVAMLREIAGVADGPVPRGEANEPSTITGPGFDRQASEQSYQPVEQEIEKEPTMTDSTSRFCTTCGASRPPESKFCPSCGKQGAAAPTETPSPEKKPSPTLDKELFRSWVGGLMIFGGLIAAAYFFFIFNTAVDVPIQEIFGQSVGGVRVNNLGLMSQRQNGIIFSFGAAIVGAAIELFARLRK